MTSLRGEPVPTAVDVVAIELSVNGRREVVEVPSTETLLETLRERLKLFGAREGCGVGMCGTCTVLLDMQPVSSCLTLTVLASGREITTIEGLSVEGSLHPVQQAFVEHTGFQCSYCTPGFVLSTVALLAANENPSPDEAREYLSGNLCRCGSYVKILDSVMRAKDLVQHSRRESAPPNRRRTRA